ncbi:MAG: hypothetical protein IID39_01570 [Planctomycetes bacterium]|nr:hypothetical protein [Planctomycetota bacterium]
MSTTDRRFLEYLARCAVVLFVAGVGGCSDHKPSVEYRQLEGTVEKIDLVSGLVTLRYRNPKTNEERKVEGSVTKETEILVNGKLAALKDIRIGEHVSVHGRVERIGKVRRITALKIVVNRDETVTFGPSSADD